MTQFEMMTSAVLLGRGMSSIVPRRNSTLVTPASPCWLREIEHLVGHVEAIGLARGPTRFADKITSIPPPEPRSSTASPGRSSATAVGLPQPSGSQYRCFR